MTGLGDRLKEARTSKGYSLDDLQSITKIQKRYLSGIENEDYSMMPGSFYVRAFIKQYSEAVGLDADEMLSLYKESAKHEVIEEETSQIAPPMGSRRGLKRNSQLNETIPKIIVALFIIVIIVVVWVLWPGGSSNNDEGEVKPEEKVTLDDNPPPVGSNDSSTDEADEEEIKPDPDPVEEVKEQVLAYQGTTGENSTYTLTDADEFKLKIVLVDESWIGVRDANNEELTAKAQVLKAGDTVELDVTDKEYIRIRVGRTYNTEIYVNDEKLEYGSDGITQNIIIEYKKGE